LLLPYEKKSAHRAGPRLVMGSEPLFVVLWWLVFFFSLGFVIEVVCFVLWSNWICFVVCIYIYIYIYCINLMIIETIQEVDATGVHRSTL
jgi:hypothetical protein